MTSNVDKFGRSTRIIKHVTHQTDTRHIPDIRIKHGLLPSVPFIDIVLVKIDGHTPLSLSMHIEKEPGRFINVTSREFHYSYKGFTLSSKEDKIFCSYIKLENGEQWQKNYILIYHI